MDPVEDFPDGFPLGLLGSPPGDFSQPHRALQVGGGMERGLRSFWLRRFQGEGPEAAENLLVHPPDVPQDNEPENGVL
jgi:hypothetical protein